MSGWVATFYPQENKCHFSFESCGGMQKFVLDAPLMTDTIVRATKLAGSLTHNLHTSQQCNFVLYCHNVKSTQEQNKSHHQSLLYLPSLLPIPVP